MQKIVPQKVGLVVGLIAGTMHFAWSILVALGWAQTYIDFVFNMHFLRPALIVSPFIWTQALFLVSLASCIGFAVGYVFSLLWNYVHKNS